MPNRWIEFIREWAKQNQTTYSCALSDPELKIAYRLQFPITTSKPLPKDAPKVIATFQDGFYRNYAITKDGEVLEITKAKDIVFLKDKGTIQEALRFLLNNTQALFTNKKSLNLSEYTKDEKDNLKKLGLMLKKPSLSVLKIFLDKTRL
jgi:hypothetical protein